MRWTDLRCICGRWLIRVLLRLSSDWCGCSVLSCTCTLCYATLCCAVLCCPQAYREHGKGQARAKKDSRNRNRSKKRAKAAAAKRAVPEVGLNLGGWVSENSRTAEQN